MKTLPFPRYHVRCKNSHKRNLSGWTDFCSWDFRVTLSDSEQVTFSMLSGDQDNREAKKRRTWIKYNKIQSQGPIPPAFAQLLASFKDFFPEDLPQGVPPSRATDHIIDLIPNAVPLSHRVYGMNPEEDRALKSQLDEYTRNGWIEPAHSAYTRIMAITQVWCKNM